MHRILMAVMLLLLVVVMMVAVGLLMMSYPIYGHRIIVVVRAR